jgi:hypothetical protein
MGGVSVSDEVREAAERVRHYRAAAEASRNGVLSMPMIKPRDVSQAEATIVGAYLAETDPTPTTAEWLADMGFERGISGKLTYGYRYAVAGPRAIEVTIRNGDAIANLIPVPTRGAVRRLAAALGVALGE